MTTKWCSEGKHEVDVTEFWKRGNTLQPNCKTCQGKLNRERHKERKSEHVTNIRANTLRRNGIFKQWKTTLRCSLCPETHPSCLDFHHLDPSHKEFSIGDAFNKRGLDAVVDEIGKCVVLCSNCHRKVHDGVLMVSEQMICNPTLLKEMINAKQ